MKEIICSGFGHRDIHYNQEDLQKIIYPLITEKGVTTFYTGGMGNFDNSFSSAVKNLKKEFHNIKLCLVVPYLTKNLTINQEYYKTIYDEVFVPDINHYYKSAITLRNRWIVDRSDYIISGVYHTFGGAYIAMKYAQKINKFIIRI